MAETSRYVFAPLPKDTPELNDALRRISVNLQNLSTRLEEFIEFSLEIFGFAAYGGMMMSASTVFSDLGAAWQDVTVYDAEILTPRGMTFDPATDRFTFTYPGVYLLSTSFTFRHNELNAGRETSVRFYDHTSASGLPSVAIGTARNVDVSSYANTSVLQITSDMVGNEFGIQIGNGDTYSSVVFLEARISACAAGEWQGGFA